MLQFPESALAGSPWINLVPVIGWKVEENVVGAPPELCRPRLLYWMVDQTTLCACMCYPRQIHILALELVWIDILQWSVYQLHSTRAHGILIYRLIQEPCYRPSFGQLPDSSIYLIFTQFTESFSRLQTTEGLFAVHNSGKLAGRVHIQRFYSSLSNHLVSWGMLSGGIHLVYGVSRLQTTEVEYIIQVHYRKSTQIKAHFI